jgi:hypothetical protein
MTAAVVVALLAPRTACALEAKRAVLLPIQAQNVGKGTQAAVIAMLVERLPELGLEIESGEKVDSALEGCEAGGCDALAIGEALGVDIVLAVAMGGAGEGLKVRIVAWHVADGSSKEAEADSDKAGILSAAYAVAMQVLPEPDPCLGIDCSGHGICVSAEGKAWCDCDKGYKAEGRECEKWEMKTTAGEKEKKPLLDQATARSVKRTAGAGYVFAGLSLATFAAAYISLAVHLKPTGEVRPGKKGAEGAFMAFQIAAMTAHALATPLLLGSSLKARRAMRQGASAQNISAWVIYAAALGTMGVTFWKDVGFAFASVTIPILISGAWVSIWEARQAVKVANGSLRLGVVPYAMALEGGFAAGLAGRF